MTLPASQQHALDAIDDVLQSDEPQLATMFGVFTDLHQPGGDAGRRDAAARSVVGEVRGLGQVRAGPPLPPWPAA